MYLPILYLSNVFKSRGVSWEGGALGPRPPGSLKGAPKKKKKERKGKEKESRKKKGEEKEGKKDE